MTCTRGLLQGQVADEKQQPPASSGQNVQLVHWWVLFHWLQQGIEKKNSAVQAIQAMGGAGRNPGGASVGGVPSPQCKE